MSSFFGQKPDPKQALKDQKKDLRRGERELTRERQHLERQEGKLIGDIKRAHKTGDTKGANVLAKQLVQLRKQKTRLLGMGSTMQGVSMQATSMVSTVTMANSMKTATKAMGAMNAQIDPAALAATMAQFEQAGMKMEMTQETMDDALDSIFDDPDADAEADAIVDEVLDELGIEMNTAFSGVKAPSNKAPVEHVNEADMDDAFMARLAGLAN